MAEAPALANLIVDAARAIGATVAESPIELIGAKFNSEILSEAVSNAPIARHEIELPDRMITVRIDDIPVLIGELTGNPSKATVDPQLRRYRNQATIARSWLAGEAPNLQLFLIGPMGTDLDPAWRQLAAEIETDDRTCRKLVWLFDRQPTASDAEAFLGRTFVARPWPTNEQQVILDSVASYALPDGWEEAVDEQLDYVELIEKLISLEADA